MTPPHSKAAPDFQAYCMQYNWPRRMETLAQFAERMYRLGQAQPHPSADADALAMIEAEEKIAMKAYNEDHQGDIFGKAMGLRRAAEIIRALRHTPAAARKDETI